LPPDFNKVEFGEIPSLIHDDAFFAATKGVAFHNGLFDALKAMF
jgi:hypothetical protein